jgi:hypothetical protein
MRDNLPSVLLRFERAEQFFQPGEILSGEYRLESDEPIEVSAVELSVLWYTEGKGNEDMAVHLFERTQLDREKTDDQGATIDAARQSDFAARPGYFAAKQGDFAARPGRFSVELPRSPLSYDGADIKIRWTVRVRFFTRQGREILGEKPFVLGRVGRFSAELA